MTNRDVLERLRTELLILIMKLPAKRSAVVAGVSGARVKLVKLQNRILVLKSEMYAIKQSISLEEA